MVLIVLHFCISWSAVRHIFRDPACAQGDLSEPPCILKAPAARGLVAIGLTGGSVLLVDPRAKLAAQHSIAAHSAGLADLDVHSDMLATCGYGTRQGQIISDSYVKVGVPTCHHIVCQCSLSLVAAYVYVS